MPEEEVNVEQEKYKAHVFQSQITCMNTRYNSYCVTSQPSLPQTHNNKWIPTFAFLFPHTTEKERETPLQHSRDHCIISSGAHVGAVMPNESNM